MLDTHCHIDEEAFDADREEVIARQRESGVEAIVVPGVNVASVATVLAVCHAHPGYCYPALGLHPEDVKEDWQTQLSYIENAIRTHREELVAVGEIGLDYHWDKTFVAGQHEVLRRQLLLAGELRLPVILHNREATQDILHILREVQSSIAQSPDRKLTGVFHCYNGSVETAKQILDLGFCLGIGGVLTFKNCKLADVLHELAETTPWLLDRLVLETDAPYMAPVPHRGERNESRLMSYVVTRLATALGTTEEEIVSRTSGTARRLFSILPASSD